MISQSKYLPAQMNGPVINSWMKAVEDEVADDIKVMDYLYNIKISNAQKTELENIGRIIGYPRPIVPVGFDQENLLLLTSLPQPIDQTIGLASDTELWGGLLASTEPSEDSYMSLDLYRRMLPVVAQIKRYGITIASVDGICALISSDYTIEWLENKDIQVTFNTPIGYKLVYILTQLFYRFSTVPQVIINSEA